MSLSDREKEVLAQMERQLRGEDPHLADSLHSSQATASAIKPGPRAWAAAGSLFALGLMTLVLGVSLPYGWASILVGIIGFVFMLGGVLLPLSTRAISRLGGPGVPPRSTKIAKKSSTKGAKRGSFMSRQQDRWDNRRPN